MFIDVILYQCINEIAPRGLNAHCFFSCGGFVIPKSSMRTPHCKLGIHGLQP